MQAAVTKTAVKNKQTYFQQLLFFSFFPPIAMIALMVSHSPKEVETQIFVPGLRSPREILSENVLTGKIFFNMTTSLNGVQNFR